MTHARQQIREAVATALTGLTTTSTRVHQSRMRPVGDTGLPCLLVSTDTEEITQSMQTRLYRDLTITVRGFAKATANLDDTLDTIASEVEMAMQSAGTLSGKTSSGLVLRRIDVDMDDTLDKPAGVIALQYQAQYFTAAGTPGTIV